jgi:hypothetical protein
MKIVIVLFLFGFMTEKLRAQEPTGQEVNEMKGLTPKPAREISFNFRLASAASRSKKEYSLIKSFSLGPTDLKKVDFYLDYLQFHSPDGDYSYPMLLNKQTNNMFIGSLPPTK